MTSGAASITTTGSNLLVTQSSQNAIISWDSFSVGGGASAHFENGTGATLNRVTGNLPSSIDGSLTATGSLYLVNPAGVAIGTAGMIRMGGSFVASTHDAADADFLDGGRLTLKGDSKAAVVNKGFVTSLSGNVVLTARRVENAGTIEAPNGSVGLLGGYEVELRDTSLADGKFAVKIGGPDTEVVNSGTVRAAEVEMRANGGSVQALAGNTKAIVKATGVKKVGGRIFLTAGSGGTVKVTQKMVARRAVQPARQAEIAALPDFGPLPTARPDFSGGEVHISGSTVSLGGEIDAAGAGGDGGTITATAPGGSLSVLSTAALEASGDTGGLVLLGGDWQGGADPARRTVDAPLATAAATSVAAGATVHADGTQGVGGTVVVWSDGATVVKGQITASGGVRGDGGAIETSGHTIDFAGVQIDASAPAGQPGQWLIDPEDLTIDAASASTISATLDGGTPTVLMTTATTASGLGVVTPGGAGDITVAASISWSSGAALNLYAYHSIAINAPITITGAGGLVLDTNFGDTGGTLSFNSPVRFTGAPAGDQLAIEGNTYRLLYNMADMQSMNQNRAGHYALATSLNASTVSNWRPIGTDPSDAAVGFTGSFTGLGNTISDLSMSYNSLSVVGLFSASSGDISDIGLVNVSVAGRAQYASVGGLVGRLDTGGTIRAAYVTGDVSGTNAIAVGGLVGTSSGSISQSYTDVAVGGVSAATTPAFFPQVGGLVGAQIGGSISQSHAAGPVGGFADYAMIGGLAGYVSVSSIGQSYATGLVLGLGDNITAGGLVGLGDGAAISQSYATGFVTAEGGAAVGGLAGVLFEGSIDQSYSVSDVEGKNSAYVGGLVGAADGGTVVQAYATGDVAGGDSASVGGLVGRQEDESSVSQVYATGSVTGGDSASVGGLVGKQIDDPHVSQAYATGSVTGGVSASLGGLVGTRVSFNNVTAVIEHGYFDGDTTGQPAGVGSGPQVGVAALSSAAGTAFAKASYAGFDWTVWSPPSSGGTNYYPELYGVSGVVGVDYGSQSITYGDAPPAFGASVSVYGIGYFNSWTTLPGAGSTTSTDAGVHPIESTGGAAAFKPGGASRIVGIGTLTINPALLTITANNASKTYGQTTTFTGTEFTASGLRNSDTVGMVTLASTGAAAAAGVAGSPYAITASAASGGTFKAANYNITYVDGKLTINPFALTIKATAEDKVYDGTRAATVTLGDNRVAGDELTVTGTALFDSKNAGTNKTVTVSGITLTGADANNYTLANAGAATLADITQRALTVTAAGQGKVYDGTRTATVTYGDNRVAGDKLTITGTALFDDKNVGTDKRVKVTEIALTGGDAGNYTLAETGTLTLADITKRALAVTATAQNKVYDGTTAASVQLADSRVANDELTVTADAASFGDRNVGTNKAVTVTGIALAGRDAGNYTFDTTVNTTADITARLLAIATAGTVAGSRVYDGTTGITVLSEGVLSGVVGQDAVRLTLTAAYADKNVGTNKAVTGSYTLKGVDARNYTLASSGFSANADITSRVLVVTAAAQDKVYDGTRTATVTYGDNRIAGDKLTVIGTALFDNKKVGMNKAVTGTYALGGVDAGNYTLASSSFSTNADITAAQLAIATAGTVTGSRVYDGTTGIAILSDGALSGVIGQDDVGLDLTAAYGDRNVGTNKAVTGSYTLGGVDAGNYTLASSSFSANADITAAQLAIATAGTVAGSRVYDGTTGIAILSDGALSGVIGQDDVGLDLTAAYGDKNVGTNKTVTGTYALAGADAGNYTLASRGFSANADITVRPITVRADDRQRLPGYLDPVLTWAVTGGSLASSDTLGGVFSGSLARDPGEDVGVYAIGQGTFAADANYAMIFLPGVFIIEVAPSVANEVSGQQNPRKDAPLLSSAPGGADSAVCSQGVLGPDCVPHVSPDNRNLGPYISTQ